MLLVHVLLLVGAHASVLPTASPLASTAVAASGTYRALVADRVGEQFREVATIAEIPFPELAADEVLVRVVYAGVNGGCETFRARGEFAFTGNRDSEQFALGAEGVGIVAAVGDAVSEDSISVGDAVCFVGSGFAEYTKAKAAMLWKVPTPSSEMAALRISALTACAMMEITGKVRQGEVVLVTAAAGGAGHFAVQFAKLAGCTVIGTCSSDEKALALCKLGCDHIINYKKRDVGEALRKIAPDGVDVAFEGVGGKMLKTALEHLKDDGRLLCEGRSSHPRPLMTSSLNPVPCMPLTARRALLPSRQASRIYLRVPPQPKPGGGERMPRPRGKHPLLDIGDRHPWQADHLRQRVAKGLWCGRGLQAARARSSRERRA